MRLPIPNDWENTWACISLQWPDSTLWFGVLRGAIDDLHAGRHWNEKTGSILAVQAVAKQIWDRNYPMVLCDGDSNPPETIYIDRVVYVGGCAPSGDCEDDMSCVKPNDFEQRADGLYLYCGCDWVKIFDVATLADDINAPDLGDDPLSPDGGVTPGTYDACGKADAAVEKFWAVGHSVWTAATSGATEFWQWPQEVYGDHPDLEGGLNMLIAALITAQLVDAAFTDEDVFPDIKKQNLKCWLADNLADDAGGMTRDLLNDFMSTFDNQWSWQDGVSLALISSFWKYVADFIGPGDFTEVMILGAQATDKDCNCTTEAQGYRDYFPDPPSGMTWDYTFDFRDASFPAWLELNAGCFHTGGIGIWGNCGTTNNNNQAACKIRLDQLNNGSTVKYIHFVWQTPGLSDDYNNASGCAVKVEDTTHFDATNYEFVSGTNPAAGIWTLTKVVNDPLGAGEDIFDLSVNGYHITGTQLDDTAANSFKLIGLRIAGTGPGPMSAPPA